MDVLFWIPIIVIVVYVFSSIKILAEYERGVVFRLGRVLPQPKGPGLILVFAPVDRMVRISLRIEAMEVPPQDVVTRDNVTRQSECGGLFPRGRPDQGRPRSHELPVCDLAGFSNHAA